MADPDNHAWGNQQIENPHKHLFHGFYAGALGYVMIPDDPNWGYAFVMTVLNQAAPAEKTLPHVLARLGQERGMWKNGIKGVGDLIGQTYARMAEFDCESEWILRKQYRAARRYPLVPVDVKERIYRMPMHTAPEPFGGNIIRLAPDKGAKELVVDFRGIYDPDTYADWRACIVVVDGQGRCRYSPLWNKGEMTMPIQETDLRFWLTVAGTPQALANFTGVKKAQPMDLYERDFLYAYPYEVTLKECRPGSSHDRIGDIENSGMVFGERYGLPHPPDDRQFDRVKRDLDALIARHAAAAPGLEAWMADYAEKEAWFRAEHRQQRHRAWIASAVTKAKSHLEDAKGQRHANGGGWVAASAEVAATAYVGPECMVLDGAKVLDHAILEAGAVVAGEGTVVAEHARIAGALVDRGRKTKTYARVQRNNNTERFEARLKVKGRIDHPLEADFAMDRPEKVLLEDWFKSSGEGGPYPSRLSRMYRVYHSGILYGEPGSVVDGERRGFTFNGRDQYAETGSEAVDFYAATIDLVVKWDGKPGEAIFDFGSGPDRSMVLLAAGDSGKPELIVKCKEDSFSLPGNVALRKGRWERLRVEVDGKQTRIIINSADDTANSRETSFRPAHLFPGGQARRNFIAAKRDRSSFFTGAIDYVRIYHTVVEKFGEGPSVPVTSGSRRVSADRVQRILDFYDVGLAKAQAEAEAEAEVEAAFSDEDNSAELEFEETPSATPSAADHLAMTSSSSRPANTEGIQGALEVQQADWFTTVSWDDRLRWEVSGEISPHLQRWLARMKPDKYKPPVIDPKFLKPDPDNLAKVAALDKAGLALMQRTFMTLGSKLPEAASWAYDPVAVTETSLKMAAVKLNPSLAVEYKFEAMDGGHSSGWQADCVYEDKGLDKNRTYTYRAHMRAKGGKAIKPSAPRKGKTDLGESYIKWSDMGLPYMGTWAARYHSSHASVTHSWTAKEGNIMVSLPPDGRTAEKMADAPFLTPRLDYVFRFDKPGTYWIWLAGFWQGYADAEGADTICVGLDLEPIQQVILSHSNLGYSGMWWPWRPPTIEIKEAGYRRISIWAREGGTRFGRIVVTNKSPRDFMPTNQKHKVGQKWTWLVGDGVPDSPRVGDGMTAPSFDSDERLEDDSLGLDDLLD